MRDPQGKNRQHADALRKQGIEVIELDVTKNDSVERAVRTVLDDVGHIDVLINNAGIASVGVSEAFTPEQTQALFEVNVFGLACAMKRRLGPIFNAANDAVEQALSKTSLAEVVLGIG